jgi:hypothetical protein
MVQEAPPTPMKRVTRFLLASRPTWKSPPPMESRLLHSHLYASPRRFPVEPHLLLGCSHKIPNGTSSAFDLARCSTTTSNILGLCSQGLSAHVLPHAAPGFFAGCECKGCWIELMRGLLRQLLHLVPSLPRTNRWILCTVQLW